MDEQERNLAFIKQLPFFSIFSDAEKEYLSNLNNHAMSCKPGHVIVRQGDIDASLFILFKGKARIFKSERPNVVLNHLKPGDIFGEISYFKKTVRMANAFADTLRQDFIMSASPIALATNISWVQMIFSMSMLFRVACSDGNCSKLCI